MKATNILLLAALGGFLMANRSIGQTWTWTQTSAPTNDWTSIAMSANGKVLAVAGPQTSLFISTNSGVTFATNSQQFAVTSVSSSADGSRLFVPGGLIILPGKYSEYIAWISQDFGMSWTEHSLTANGSYAAGSADGKVLMASGGLGSQSSFSTDSGNTWHSMASGSRCLIGASGSPWMRIDGGSYDSSDGFWVSTNHGINWVSNALPDINVKTFAMSADGSRIVAASSYNSGGVWSGSIYVSTNTAVSWTTTSAPSNSWWEVASSADGGTLAAIATSGGRATTGGSIYTSTDGGMTWVLNNASITNWTWVAISADGSKLAACVYNGGVWVAQLTSAPQMDIAPATGGLKLSWILPATNFVLQSSCDLSHWATLVSPAPVLNLTNLQDEITLPLPGPNRFYRLKTP